MTFWTILQQPRALHHGLLRARHDEGHPPVRRDGRGRLPRRRRLDERLLVVLLAGHARLRSGESEAVPLLRHEREEAAVVERGLLRAALVALVGGGADDADDLRHGLFVLEVFRAVVPHPAKVYGHDSGEGPFTYDVRVRVRTEDARELV